MSYFMLNNELLWSQLSTGQCSSYKLAENEQDSSSALITLASNRPLPL